jgi:hypothetical protein
MFAWLDRKQSRDRSAAASTVNFFTNKILPIALFGSYIGLLTVMRAPITERIGHTKYLALYTGTVVALGARTLKFIIGAIFYGLIICIGMAVGNR